MTAVIVKRTQNGKGGLEGRRKCELQKYIRISKIINLVKNLNVRN